MLVRASSSLLNEAAVTASGDGAATVEGVGAGRRGVTMRCGARVRSEVFCLRAAGRGFGCGVTTTCGSCVCAKASVAELSRRQAMETQAETTTARIDAPTATTLYYNITFNIRPESSLLVVLRWALRRVRPRRPRAQ